NGDGLSSDSNRLKAGMPLPSCLISRGPDASRSASILFWWFRFLVRLSACGVLQLRKQQSADQLRRRRAKPPLFMPAISGRLRPRGRQKMHQRIGSRRGKGSVLGVVPLAYDQQVVAPVYRPHPVGIQIRQLGAGRLYAPTGINKLTWSVTGEN